jgi:hypothetical protein
MGQQPATAELQLDKVRLLTNVQHCALLPCRVRVFPAGKEGGRHA